MALVQVEGNLKLQTLMNDISKTYSSLQQLHIDFMSRKSDGSEIRNNMYLLRTMLNEYIKASMEYMNHTGI